MKILKFYTDSCMPCRIVGKILEGIEGVEVIPINALENTEAVDKYEVCTTPTLIFLKDDEEVARTVGMTSKENIESLVKMNI